MNGRFKSFGLVLVGAPQEDQPSALHRLAPTVPHRVISGASHWIQMDEPPQLNPMLDEFLARAK